MGNNETMKIDKMQALHDGDNCYHSTNDAFVWTYSGKRKKKSGEAREVSMREECWNGLGCSHHVKATKERSCASFCLSVQSTLQNCFVRKVEKVKALYAI